MPSALHQSLLFLLKLCTLKNRKAMQVCFEATKVDFASVHAGRSQMADVYALVWHGLWRF